ncbi:hypothetical protein FM076_23990 [Streptomyces albus subsp. chlorinus]|uniref:hypothetical protein n=1 Tax=Streptomyces albus TaxID=1888 RepID=UPI0015706C78|nr:hypothetical protein [Streptomyces albus]NSC24042.1 hypothetical protein [Streptomyces albus subsp. chlorinus]
MRRGWYWAGGVWAVLVVAGGGLTLLWQEEPEPSFGWYDAGGESARPSPGASPGPSPGLEAEAVRRGDSRCASRRPADPPSPARPSGEPSPSLPRLPSPPPLPSPPDFPSPDSAASRAPVPVRTLVVCAYTSD